MSYSKFLDDLNEFYKDRHDRGVVDRISMDDALSSVRDEWLARGRHQELISFILENWDSGNCDGFMRPLLEILLQTRDSRSFKRLWKGVLRHRVNSTRMYFAYLKTEQPAITVNELDKVDLAGFREFSSEETILRRTAHLRQSTLDGISEYLAGLELLGQEETEIERAKDLFRNVASMQKPRPKPKTDKRKIDKEVFWQLIEQARLDGSDKFQFLDNLKTFLEAFSPIEIRRFQRLLLETAAELDSWEHFALAYIVRKGCGVDEFDYFRFWAVSKGRESFEAIKRLDSSNLKEAFSEDPQLEPFLYLAESIYEEKSGAIMKEIRVRKSKRTGKEWSENTLKANFPRWCEQFDYSA